MFSRKIEVRYDKDKKYCKVRNHYHYTEKSGAAHSICHLKYNVPKEIPILLHNGSNYDYRFIIKEVAEESEGQHNCLGENTEKYITFSVLMEEEVAGIDKNRIEVTKTVAYKLYSAGFMAKSYSSLVNLAKGIHKIKM